MIPSMMHFFTDPGPHVVIVAYSDHLVELVLSRCRPCRPHLPEGGGMTIVGLCGGVNLRLTIRARRPSFSSAH